MHHPFELYATDLLSGFFEFPDAARRSRRYLLSRSAEQRALFLSAHFPRSSAGGVTKVEIDITGLLPTNNNPTIRSGKCCRSAGAVLDHWS